MPRNMSFMLTTDQVRRSEKTVTRRLGWWFLRPSDIVNACEKCMGLKKGEKVVKIVQIRVKSSRPELLRYITQADVVREGFPDWTAYEFVRFFCKTHGCGPCEVVNRIEFEYLDAR